MKNFLLFFMLMPLLALAQTVTTVTTVKDKTGKVIKKDSLTSSFVLPSDTVYIPVVENKPPVVAIIGNTSITGTTTALTASVSDPEGQPVSLTWEKVSGANAVLTGVNSNTLTISGLQTGQYGIRLTGIDNFGNAGIASVILNVTDPGTATRNTTFESTFESIPLTPISAWQGETLKVEKGQAWSNYQRCTSCDYSLKPSTDVVRTGKQAVRMELRKGDPLSTWGGSSRVEIQGIENHLKPGTDEWLGFSHRIENNSDGLGFSAFQLHTGSFPVFWLDGSSNTLVTRKNDGGNTYTKLPGSFGYGVWHDWQIHFITTSTSITIEIYKDGVLVTPNSFSVVNTSGSSGAYFKIGVYKFTWESFAGKPKDGNVMVAYVDNVRWGKTKNDVMP